MKIIVDVGPLQETNYTGISTVTAKLSSRFVADPDVDVFFAWERYIIPHEVIKSVIEINSGKFFYEVLRTGAAQVAYLDEVVDNNSVMFFTNTGKNSRVCDKQVQFVHDLTTILFPETHNIDTINFHRNDFINSKKNIDYFICNSQCTADDMKIYMGCDNDQVGVAYLGYEKPKFECKTVITDNYVCVLGTLEPRKNNDIIFEYITNNIEILNKIKFVFVGRFGWGPDIENMFMKYPKMCDAVKSKSVIFTGFVSDEKKFTIINNANCTVYASLYEGFGLPVLESIACGTPVVASYSSSIPEVGGDIAFYFDPFDHRDFARALNHCLNTYKYKSKIPTNITDDHVDLFTWEKTYTKIKQLIKARFNNV